MNKKSIFLLIILVNMSAILIYSSDYNPIGVIQSERTLNINHLGFSFSNATVISDGYGGSYWNDGTSENPSAVVDNQGNVHVVWYDETDNLASWGDDSEIMYATYSSGSGWSFPLVISDGYGGFYWNDGGSYDPSIAVDGEGGVHVVWHDNTDNPSSWGPDVEIMYATYSSGSGWSNATVISDGYGGSYWNDGGSYDPSIAVDGEGGIHVVWHDQTDNLASWGDDREIMYATYSSGGGWSNATVISDGYEGSYWNDGASFKSSIAVDGEGGIHVVWHDYTQNPSSWGTDGEIMYATYSPGSGWSNATVISDGYEGSYWNDGHSHDPSIAVDGEGGLHVVWEDQTDNLASWGDDTEIMYATYSSGGGWSNATVISDGYEGSYWNNGVSLDPSITCDGGGGLHVVWEDQTDNLASWGDDSEIMYAKFSSGSGWSFPLVISDGYGGFYWNDDGSYRPSTVADSEGGLHVVWSDDTDNPSSWGIDTEIMYTKVEASNDPENEGVPGTFTLSSNAEDPDDDGIFNLMWTNSDHAEEYSIQLEKNGTSKEFAVGLTDRTYPVMGLKTGNYTFHIEAYNEFGSVSSNKLNVTIQIPSSEQDNTDTTDDTPDDEENGNGSISFGYWYLGFLALGISCLGAIIYNKQKK